MESEVDAVDSSAVLVAPILLVLLIVATSVWVFQDASAREGRGVPVRFAAGSFEVDTPVVWAVGCLVLWVIFTPLYITCRGRVG